jgi:hypothetical protein
MTYRFAPLGKCRQRVSLRSCGRTRGFSTVAVVLAGLAIGVAALCVCAAGVGKNKPTEQQQPEWT